MNSEEFSHLAPLRKNSGAAREAARLHLVEGVEPIAEAARQAGCHRNSAAAEVRRVLEKQQRKAGLATVSVTLPHDRLQDLLQWIRNHGGDLS